ncbi:MAG: hypothetical protein ACFCUS_03490 [Rubrimonas sp.]|uniref:hypothetical protein n=1 Tax=Rubrimonas sp. TaxID=2036015 RepID=UPI002FDDDA08
MRVTDEMLDLLEPVRDLCVADLLAGMGEALNDGGEVDAEPVDRDADGHIRRAPPLNLPRRHDFSVRAHGATILRRTSGRAALRFAPVTTAVDDRAAARIAPFDWAAADIHLVWDGPGAPDWTPLRRWYLEWFQARFGEESPDLLGVVHALHGPRADAAGWRVTVDLGSCSVRGFGAMLAALARAGFRDIRIGETEDAL